MLYADKNAVGETSLPKYVCKSKWSPGASRKNPFESVARGKNCLAEVASLGGAHSCRGCFLMHKCHHWNPSGGSEHLERESDISERKSSPLFRPLN